MKRGRKQTTSTTTRTLSGNELRKRLRLIGPIIGAEFNLNPEAKSPLKKPRTGRSSWQILDCETQESWQKNGTPIPETALLLQKSPSEKGFDAKQFNNITLAIWATEPDELCLQTLQVLFGNQTKLAAQSSTILGWGAMLSSVSTNSVEAIVQATGAAVQGWGFGRLVISRIQSAMSRIVKSLAQNGIGTPITLQSGCDGVLCEFVVQVPFASDADYSPEFAELLSQLPYAVVTVERGKEVLSIRMISRSTSLAFEGGPASIICFPASTQESTAEKLPKAS